MRTFLSIGTALVLLSATTLHAQTVTLSLTSPQNGGTVAPGATINWSIDVAASAVENAGLALVIVDLVQAETNPAKMDIPPADAVPAAMANFSRPAGISNPGETDPITGYTGVQRGTAGEMNLVQIGGAQNTFGVALPAGAGIAESANVVGGVGQGVSVTLAAGSFSAPAAAGTYTFQLENAIANVLTEVNTPPQHSQAIGAPVILANASIAITVGDETCDACDANCDGEGDGRDIQEFIDALLAVAPPAGCSSCAGDFDGSGDVTLDDVVPFVNCLLGQ